MHSQMVQIFQNWSYIAQLYTYIHSQLHQLFSNIQLNSQVRITYEQQLASQLANPFILAKQKLHSYLLLQPASQLVSQLNVNLFVQNNYCNCSGIQSKVHLIFIQLQLHMQLASQQLYVCIAVALASQLAIWLHL